MFPQYHYFCLVAGYNEYCSNYIDGDVHIDIVLKKDTVNVEWNCEIRVIIADTSIEITSKAVNREICYSNAVSEIKDAVKKFNDRVKNVNKLLGVEYV